MKYLKLIIGNAVTLFIFLPLVLIVNGFFFLFRWICDKVDLAFDTLQDWSNGE